MRAIKALLHSVAPISFLGLSGLSPASTLIYPGGAPCDGSLQACLDGAAAGDVVELATNGPIDEDLAIAKSLTLRAADGFAPVIGGGAEERLLSLCSFSTSETAPISVVIEGLVFDMSAARCQLGSAQPHHQITVRDSTFDFIIDEPAFPVLDFNLQSPADVVIEGNTVEFAIDHNGVAAIGIDVRNAAADVGIANNRIASTGAGVSIFGTDATNLRARVNRNHITASNPANSGIGIEFDFRNGGTYSAAALGNVIYGVGGCNCGRNSGIHITTPSFTGEATFTATNNTIAATEARAAGLLAVLQGTGQLTLNLYNNNLSRNGGAGFSLNNSVTGQLLINADANNSFNNFDSFLNVEPLAPTDLDPLFVDEAAHDYRLRADSPLIDSGIDDPIGGTAKVDAEGDFRRSGAAIDIGAYEFASVAPRFYTDRTRFLTASGAEPASAPFAAINAPPEPFASGDVMFDAIHPSTLHFGSWPADFPVDNNVELAINDKEDLDITVAGGVVYAMGIDFDDTSGGVTPSTFEITAKTRSSELVRFEFQTQEMPEQNYIGIWSREPFDRLEIRETTTANENEFFGTVAISRRAMPWFVFENGFER